MKKKLKLRKNLNTGERKNPELVNLSEYYWPNAYVALKGYFLFCIFRKKYDIPECSNVVHKKFVTDVASGVYDYQFDALRPIINHPQKRQLLAINCTSFNDLIQSNPALLAGAYIK